MCIYINKEEFSTTQSGSNILLKEEVMWWVQGPYHLLEPWYKQEGGRNGVIYDQEFEIKGVKGDKRDSNIEQHDL